MKNLPELMCERFKLKQALNFYKILLLLACIILLCLIFPKNEQLLKDHVAKITVDYEIVEDDRILEVFKEIKKNQHAKALIIHFNSPGGTAYGGEMLHNAIAEMSHHKPVVSTFGTMATSAAYMAAVASHYIISGYSTVTGSIGVIMQSFDITDLLQKIGITSETYKSSPYKAMPSPYEKTPLDVKMQLENEVMLNFHYFANLVQKNRNLSDQEISKVANGKIYTGQEAFDLKLVDELGSEKEALEWLNDEYEINPAIEVKSYAYSEKENDLLSVSYWFKAIYHALHNKILR